MAKNCKAKPFGIIALITVVLVFGLTAGMAFAAGFGKIADLGKGSGLTAKQIVSDYAGGAGSVNSADIKMLRAVGLKEEADKLELQAKNLTEGATNRKGFEDAAKAQSEASKALEERLKGQKFVMDEDSKKMFTDGMVDFGKGLAKYTQMSTEIKGYKPSASDLGPDADSASYIVSSLPDSITSLSGTLKSIIDFAKGNNISVPKECTDLLP